MRINSLIMRSKGLLDWVYPPKCALCGLVGNPPICDECRAEFIEISDSRKGRNGPLDWSHSLYHFEGRAAQAVKRLKYTRATSLGRPMAQLLEEGRKVVPDHDVIVPVPIHPSRLRWRGFNQSDLLVESMPSDLVERALMVRVKKTRPQVELTPGERRANLRGAFLATDAVKGRHVLIVDDVVTTGGTAVACAEALKLAGAQEVGLLTFCGDRTDRGSGIVDREP